MGNEKVDLVRIANPEKKSLLERYEIPVGQLSYEYINDCNDVKKLERIIIILRSGEEGFYPDLTKHAENRLEILKPSSIILRKAEPILKRDMLGSKERKEIEDDIREWMSEMRNRERDLEEGKAVLSNVPLKYPEVRHVKEKVKKAARSEQSKIQRIAAWDYASWEKYDADTEISRIDLEEEKRRAEAKEMQRKQREAEEAERTARKTIADELPLTGTELDVMAKREREKGNEAFRAGDYGEALRYYDSSIEICSHPLSYNNRAITLVKLRRYEDAIEDCNRVLAAEYTNIKALLRRAVALECLGKSSQALVDYEAVLKLEPTNKVAIAAVNTLRKPCQSKKVRMKIEEECDIKEEENIENNVCFCDRAPGPSRNSEPMPHFKASYCYENEIREPLKNSNIPSLVPKPTVKSKSIFSCVASNSKNSSGVIIEEIPNESGNIESPYEFLCTWESLRNDADLSLHAKLLRRMSSKDLKTGNKLDADMLGLILRCLEQHFRNPEDAQLVNYLLHSISQLSRFSIVNMLLDSQDKESLRNILLFLEKQGSPDIKLLQEAYSV